MKNINTYDIHGVTLLLESRNTNLIKSIEHQLRYFKTYNDKNQDYDVVIKDYSTRPTIVNYQVASDYYFFEKGLMHIPDHKLCFDISGSCHIYYLNHFTIPVNLIVQLAILKKGMTLVHSAAFSFNGNNILLPALGGIGKTTIVSHAMKQDGNLFGDDMCIIDRNANMFAYPIDFSVYDYHYSLLGIKKSFKRKIFGILGSFLKLFDRVPLVSWFTSRIRGRFFPAFENISPIEIYGKEKVAKNAIMNRLFYIIRHKDSENEVKESQLSSKTIADRLTTILLSEWKDSITFLKIYSTFSDDFCYIQFCNNINAIVFEMSSKIHLKEISIDSNINNDRYISILWNLLQK